MAGTTSPGSTLTTSNGSWNNTPTGYGYQWLRCDSNGNACSSIVGATASTFGLSGSDVGASIRVNVTASNAGGSATAQSGPTAVVAAPTPPPSSSAGWWASSSFWNQPIPAGAALDPNSQSWTNALLANANVQAIYVNSDIWTVNVFHAAAGTPTATIAIANSGKRITIPYQAGWSGTPDSDSHLAVIDDSNGCEYEFQGFDAAGKTAVALEVNNIRSGSGAHVGDAGVGGGQLSLLGGLITPQDVDSGRINHALRIATPINSPASVVPAVDSDGTHAGGIPEGQLLRLDPALDLTPYNLNAFQTMVARALQTYGAYDADSSSSLITNTESTYDGSSYSQPPSPLPKSLISHLQFLSPLYSSVPLGTNYTPGCAQPQ